MGFKEWNLDKALYYIGFNFITSFHFQYSTSDPVIFGNNNIFMIFLCVSNRFFYLIPYSTPSFFYHFIEFILIRYSPCSLFSETFKFMLYIFYCISLFFITICVPNNMATFHVVGCCEPY
jgi:hypothetical protein